MPRTPRCQLGIVEDDALGEVVSEAVAQRSELNLDGFESLCFGGATLVVEAVELVCEVDGAGRIFGEE